MCIRDRCNVTRSYNQFIKRKKPLINCVENIYFNKKCLQLNIFPKYTKIIVKNNNNNKLNKYITQAQYTWIKDEISNNYRHVKIIIVTDWLPSRGINETNVSLKLSLHFE